MNTKQRIHFFSDLWRPACAVKGWDANDRELRLSTLSEWLGREITTLEEVGSGEEFTEVKARCLALFKPADLKAQLRQTSAAQSRLKLRWKVTVEQVKLLAAFMSGVNQWTREGQAQVYIEAILRKPPFRCAERFEDALRDMPTTRLQTLCGALERTIRSKQRKAGWSDEELRANAGLAKEEAVPAENIPF